MALANKGDYGYWHDAKPIKDFEGNASVPDRALYSNGGFLKNVIFPANPARGYEGDIVPIGDYEGRDFAYAWIEDGKRPDIMDAYTRLREKGYAYATTDKFKIVRESFTEDGNRIRWGDSLLMACTAERWEQENLTTENNRRRILGETLEGIDNQFEQTVASTIGDTGIRLEPITDKTAKAAKRK